MNISNLKDARVAQFAACELLLDILYAAMSSFDRKLDLEAVWVTACVLHNTMRTAIKDPEIDLGEAVLQERTRLGMSRRGIADKTGLPQETVRRRVNRLLEEGVLAADLNGGVQFNFARGPMLGANPLNQIHSAIDNYLKRISHHAVRMPLEASFQ